MIRRKQEYTVEHRPCGGSTRDFELHRRFTKEEVFGRAVFWGEIIIEPNAEIPLHRHLDNVDVFYVLEGKLMSVNEDGSEEPFERGDAMVTGGGSSHAVRNDSCETAVILATTLV